MPSRPALAKIRRGLRVELEDSLLIFNSRSILRVANSQLFVVLSTEAAIPVIVKNLSGKLRLGMSRIYAGSLVAILHCAQVFTLIILSARVVNRARSVDAENSLSESQLSLEFCSCDFGFLSPFRAVRREKTLRQVHLLSIILSKAPAILRGSDLVSRSCEGITLVPFVAQIFRPVRIDNPGGRNQTERPRDELGLASDSADLSTIALHRAPKVLVFFIS